MSEQESDALHVRLAALDRLVEAVEEACRFLDTYGEAGPDNIAADLRAALLATKGTTIPPNQETDQ
jgi:hypothetical protein